MFLSLDWVPRVCHSKLERANMRFASRINGLLVSHTLIFLLFCYSTWNSQSCQILIFILVLFCSTLLWTCEATCQGRCSSSAIKSVLRNHITTERKKNKSKTHFQAACRGQFLPLQKDQAHSPFLSVQRNKVLQMLASGRCLCKP